MKLDSVGLIVNYKKEKTRETTCRIIDWLNSKKLKVCIEGNMGEEIGKKELNCPTEKFLKEVDLIISLGETELSLEQLDWPLPKIYRFLE